MKLWETLRPIVEALVIAFLVVTFVVNTVGISGASMRPTLHDGERALVPKYEVWLRRLGFGHYQRGEIVYFRAPSDYNGATRRVPLLGLDYRPFLIKRIVATEGDHLHMENGQLYVNGRAVKEPYLGSSWQGSDSFAELVVPPDHVFVLGDNRSPLGSVDSRRFGPIPVSSIAGRAVAIIWPPLRREAGEWHWNLRWLEPPDAYQAPEQASQANSEESSMTKRTPLYVKTEPRSGSY